jgi:hypothetical protein
MVWLDVWCFLLVALYGPAYAQTGSIAGKVRRRLSAHPV